MAQLITPFDATTIDPTQLGGQLPVGKHPVVAYASEVKANKSNDGGYLQYDLRIIDGPQQGATGPYRLNLYSSNQVAVEIANRQLSAMCHVTGVFAVTDSSALHDIPFIVEVGMQKDSDKYTEVKRVFDINGNEPGKAKSAPATAPAQQAAPESTPAPTAAQPQQAAWGAPAAAPAQTQWAPAESAPATPAAAPQAAPASAPPWAK